MLSALLAELKAIGTLWFPLASSVSQREVLDVANPICDGQRETTNLVESAKELAIRAAVGATPAKLAIASLRWALMAAGVAALLTAAAMPFVASSVPLEKAAFRPTPASVLLCLLFMGMVTVAAAFRTVWRAGSVSPAAALREH